MKMTRAAWRRIAADSVMLAISHRKIEAIKHLRAHTDCGLIDAVHALDKLVTLVMPTPSRQTKCVCGVVMRTSDEARIHMTAHPEWKLQ